ncbi:MAG TPA: ribosome-binding factor A [Candidatus Paceibacterota bacterium]
MNEHLKDEKLKEAIRVLASKFVEQESNGSSLITVTRIELMDHAKRAFVMFTTLPDGKEAEALAFLERKRSEFRTYVREKSRIGRIPFFDFKIDLGEKNRQNVDKLSNLQ